ncbi:MAG TPA: hypothetical protein VJ011_11695 [Steroidobacteraceae bacterium]|nr:hypothetical protein [Steroidobacteraceae bacterium]
MMQWFERIRDRWRAQPRAVRELAIFVAALLVGVFLVPLAIYAAGRETLGDYASGGASALLVDFLRALGRGAPAFWAVALGPYVFLTLARLAVRAARRPRAEQQV